MNKFMARYSIHFTQGSLHIKRATEKGQQFTPRKTLLIDAVSLEGKDQVGYVYTTSLANTGHVVDTSEYMIAPQQRLHAPGGSQARVASVYQCGDLGSIPGW